MKKTFLFLSLCFLSFSIFAQEVTVEQVKAELLGAKDRFMTMPAAGTFNSFNKKGKLSKYSANGEEKICDFTLAQSQAFLKEKDGQVYILTESTSLDFDYYRQNAAPTATCEKKLPVEITVISIKKDTIFNQILGIFDQLNDPAVHLTRTAALVYQLKAQVGEANLEQKIDLSQGVWEFTIAINAQTTGSSNSGDLNTEYANEVTANGQKAIESYDLSKASLCEDKNDDGEINQVNECTVDWDRSVIR